MVFQHWWIDFLHKNDIIRKLYIHSYLTRFAPHIRSFSASFCISFHVGEEKTEEHHRVRHELAAGCG